MEIGSNAIYLLNSLCKLNKLIEDETKRTNEVMLSQLSYVTEHVDTLFGERQFDIDDFAKTVEMKAQGEEVMKESKFLRDISKELNNLTKLLSGNTEEGA